MSVAGSTPSELLENQTRPGVIHVRCKCGRRLRTLSDNAGRQIQCWDCRRTVVVPQPFTSSQLYLSLGDQFWESVNPSQVFLAFFVSALFCAVVALPLVGKWAAIPLLAIGGAWYCRTMVREAMRGVGEWSEQNLRMWVFWLLVGGLGAIGFLTPFLLRFNGYNRVSAQIQLVAEPFLLGWVSLIGWLVLPILVAMLCVAVGVPGVSPIGALSAMARRPFLTFLAILAVPVGLVLAELVTLFMSWHFGWLDFFLIDLVPIPADYETALRSGYPLFADLLFSLPRSLREQSLRPPTVVSLSDPVLFYMIIRCIFGSVVLTVILTATQVQARWLALIASWPARHPAASATASHRLVVGIGTAPGETQAAGGAIEGTAEQLAEEVDAAQPVASLIRPRIVYLTNAIAHELENSRARILNNVQLGPSHLLLALQEMQVRTRELADQITATLLTDLVATSKVGEQAESEANAETQVGAGAAGESTAEPTHPA